MSVLGSLEQIPLSMYYRLQECKYSSEYVAILDLYDLAKDKSDPQKWELDLAESSSSEDSVKILKSLSFNAVSMLDEVQELLDSAKLPEMYLDRDWSDMLSFLTGELYPEDASFILKDKVIDNKSIRLINALGGQRFGFFRYGYESFLSKNEVMSVSDELNSIAQDFSQQWMIRWKLLIPEMAAFDESDENLFSDFFANLLDFYKDAVKQGSSVMTSISG